MRDFNGVIVFLSLICPRNFFRVRRKCDLSGAAFMFLCNKMAIVLLKNSKTARISSKSSECSTAP